MRFLVESYGCSMNYGEGFEMQRALRELGHEIVARDEDAEAFLVNTCTVIDATERKVLKRIQALSRTGLPIVVTGCMASVQSAEVRERSPDALMIEPAAYLDFKARVAARFGSVPKTKVGPEVLGVTAIVPIAQGCLGSCNYCITRLARGGLESRSKSVVIQESMEALSAGAKELYLAAQDSGSYGVDIGADLPGLVESLCRLDGDFRIRVGMMNPDSLAAIQCDLEEAFENEKVYKFLHVPVQSGSDSVIRRMGRNYTVAQFERAVSHFRQKVPRLTLSTDVITGFPGETEQDHEATKRLLARLKPNIVNVTRFSGRPGTGAILLEDQVVSRVSKERSREITAQRFRIARAINSGRVGEAERVLVTEHGKTGTMVARDDSYTPVVIPGPQRLGSALQVQVIGATATHLLGRLVQ